MKILEFRKISLANLDEIEGLRVRSDQNDLVAENVYSIAQAGLDEFGWCRAVYMDEKPVGFFYIRDLEDGKLAYICRFMVGEQWQGQKIGLRIMKKLLDLLFASPSLDLVDLAVSRDPNGAGGFYRKCGFIETGEPYRGGWRKQSDGVKLLFLQ